MTEPPVAADMAEAAAEAVETTVEHSAGGGGGGGGGSRSSMVQLRVAGVASTFSAASIARTENWCAPSASPDWPPAAPQGLQLPLSSAHSKLEPTSLEEKARLAEVAVVVAAGPLLIEVWGGGVSGGGGPVASSTVQIRAAGVESMFSASSIARTANSCVPTSRSE